MEAIKIKLVSDRYIPAYETPGASGMDIRARLPGPVPIPPGGRALVPTGLRIELPVGYEAQIRARSGLSVKHGLTLINAVGTVDSDYRGEIKVGLVNLGDEEYTISDGDRIAQMVIAEYARAEFDIVDEIGPTERGEGGFGHTGKK
ncbi:MAG: dUTP diphosphatase [Clostridiales Family XIII bacterium]|jgi:dUTP pyrophosphatase|nr:dUTP diphosphatase [Clostridiales Family XIII bacterium]